MQTLTATILLPTLLRTIFDLTQTRALATGFVVAVVPGDAVVARASGDGVVPRPAPDGVVPGPRVDGVVPAAWDKFSGLYACGPEGRAGWVRIHTNFRHHREGILRLLGCPAEELAQRADVEAALQSWTAKDFEEAAAKAGMVVAAVRSFGEWDDHPQGKTVAGLPLISVERIGDAPPRRLVPLTTRDRPLHGVRVLELTRVLAGPVSGRTLAAYGADVMLVNGPHLPNIDFEFLLHVPTVKRLVLSDLCSPQGAYKQVARANCLEKNRTKQTFHRPKRPGLNVQ